MKSRLANDLSSCSLFGVLSTGLPPTTTMARICPGPGVSISSAMSAAGNSPSASGKLRTRDFPRPVRKPLPTPGLPRVVGPEATGSGNIAPPTMSRLPVTALSTSTNHDAVVPKLTVVVPIRPYTAARSASHSSMAMRRMVAASMPTTRATASGVNSASASCTSARPFT